MRWDDEAAGMPPRPQVAEDSGRGGGVKLPTWRWRTSRGGDGDGSSKHELDEGVVVTRSG
jgi:hypothetical protein